MAAIATIVGRGAFAFGVRLDFFIAVEHRIAVNGFRVIVRDCVIIPVRRYVTIGRAIIIAHSFRTISIDRHTNSILTNQIASAGLFRRAWLAFAAHLRPFLASRQDKEN